MAKTVKEIYQDHATGDITVEYSDDSTNKFNIADTLSFNSSSIGKNVFKGLNTTGQVLVNATLGDSRLANGRSNSATQTAVDANGTLTQVGLGDCYTSWSGPQYVAQFLSGGLVDVSEFAVFGSRVYPVAGRTDDILTNQYPSAMASTDAYVLGTIFSSANDRAASPVNAVANTLSAYSTIVREWCSSNRRLEIVLEPPQRGAYWPANAPADWSQMVSLQRQLAVEFPYLISLVDTSGLQLANGVVYPLGDTKDPYADDVHNKFRGAWLIGSAMHSGRVSKGWLPPNPVKVSIQRWLQRIADNKATNPTMTGSAAGIGGGTAPTSWATARTASNSWDKSYIVNGVPVAHAVNTAFVAGNRVVTSAYPAFDYLCVTSGTTAASIPALSQTPFATTTDGTAVWMTLPKCDDFYGVNSLLIEGVGTVDNTRGVTQQDISLASTGFAIGDEIEASVFLGVLQNFYGAQIELQAMTGTTKIRSSFGTLAAYMDSSGAVPDGTVGRMTTCAGFTIPTGTDTLRIKIQAYSKNGKTIGLLFAAPELRKR